MTTAIAGIAASVLGGLGNQGRSLAIVPRHQDTSTAGIALARDAKVAKQARKNASEERLLSLVTDPQVMGLATVLGGLWAANNMTFIPGEENRASNQYVRAAAATAVVLMGLGRAGVGDMTTLAVAGLAGAATAIPGIPGIPGGAEPILGGENWTKYLPPPWGKGGFALFD